MRVHTHNDAINAYVFVNTTPFTKENIIVIMRHNKCYRTRQLLKRFIGTGRV